MQISPINSYIKYLIYKCYEEDYNPQYTEFGMIIIVMNIHFMNGFFI